MKDINTKKKKHIIPLLRYVQPISAVQSGRNMVKFVQL